MDFGVQKAKLKELGFKTYSAYTASDWWREVRAKYEGDGRCTTCDSSDALSLHHRTYENLGNEKRDDLVWLCSTCHLSIHRGHSRGTRKTREISLQAASPSLLFVKMRKSESIQVYLSSEERGQLEQLMAQFGKKSLSGTLKLFIRLFHEKIYSTP